MKLAAIIVSRTRCIFAKLLAVPENSVKVKVRLHWTLIVILESKNDCYKQRLLHGHEITKYFQKCKC